MRAAWLGLAVWVLGQGGAAEAADGLAPGHWEGVLKPAAGGSLTMVIHVAKGDGGGAKATLTIPDQGSVGLPVDGIKVEAGELAFGLAKLKGEFKGKLNADATEAVGTWTQLGKATPLTLKRTETPTTLAVPDAILGTWEGKIKVNAGIEIRLGLKAEKRPDGARVVGFASPDQGANFLPINAAALDGAKLSLESKAILAKYTGTLNDARTEIVGEWKQPGGAFPLTLKKTDKLSEPKRQQTPRPPFSYKSEDVTYPNESAKITLGATLTIPEGKGPFPTALLITGSGAQDRDETILGHKPFAVIADALTRRGIAVLRVDDRGVGKSTGSPVDATSADFATDVAAGIAYLKTRPEVDPKRIGLVGHSEGGLIGPMVAAKSPGDVAFLVLLAGTGVNGAEILKAQSALILKAIGASDDVLKAQGRLMAEVVAVIAAEKDEKAAASRIEALAKASLALLPEAERKAIGESKAIESGLGRINSPWFRFFLTFEPKTVLTKVRCPVLALNGEKDLQVPPGQNLPTIESALKSGGNDRVTTKTLPGLNHLFQHCKTGAPSEYASTEETFAPEALALMGDWIVATTGRK
ncbi:MAG TPA: alpha/beta fold hydrolase [Isosphaeraceae bacterium]